MGALIVFGYGPAPTTSMDPQLVHTEEVRGADELHACSDD
jgi:hypothetical protein